MDPIRLSLAEVHDLTLATLLANGLGEPHAAAIARSITRAEADECHSHGIYRLPGYVASTRSGKADVAALPELNARDARRAAGGCQARLRSARHRDRRARAHRGGEDLWHRRAGDP